ncbi:MAG TPA: EAL domain-containing protein, partial [Acholeplasma sp.]|nr:EAL domain-containing protein [Acholeplasma sp.]
AFKALGVNLYSSINISAKNLSDPAFYNRTVKILDAFDIDKSYINFEITESSLMKNPELSKKIINDFNALGINFSIDDFGKGHSSLTYLSQFKIAAIKIDRYFTSHIQTDRTIQIIVDATINLAKNLGYSITCEGIEDQSSADLMTSLGCDYAQGYHYCKPIFQDDVISWYLKNEKDRKGASKIAS